MAQLTDDCFAFSGPLLPLDDMERLIGERVTPVDGTERVGLRTARGRVTAADVKAPVDLPPFDNSAVDGYAVRHADLLKDGDTRLAVAGRLTAGARAETAIEPGQAIRIFTGAAMPAGADTVFMQEDVTVDGGQVVVPKGLKLGSNRRLAGEDVAAGQVALPAGTVLEPQHIALAAALGITEIEVRRRLQVAIFSTGDEVVEPGSPRGGAAIYDANRYLLSELLERLGAVVTDLGILADDPDVLARALQGGRRRPRSGHHLGRRLDRRSRPCARRGRAHRQPGVLARRHQAGPAGGDGRDPRRPAQGLRRARGCRLRRTAGQSGGRVRDFRAGGETAAAAARRRAAAKPDAVAGARRLRLQEEKRPPRICTRRAAARRRR